MHPVRLAAIALAATWLLAGGAPPPPATIAVAASTAALVAARERRHPDMALAAGIAAGVSATGLVLLPVLLGVAIARRVAAPSAATFALAAATSAWTMGWSPAADTSLLSIAPADARILLLATACGVAAWLAASCAARSPSPRELDAACLLAGLALPLLAPVGIEAAGLAVALAIGGTRITWSPVARGANDDPLPLRALSA